MQRKRKYRASSRTPLKPFKPETGLSKRLEERITRDLVKTNKSFTEISKETGVPNDFISTLCYSRNLRTPAEHREITVQRGVETRQARKEEKAKAGERLLIKARGFSLPRSKAMDWLEKNYQSLPDLGFHLTSLADAKSMIGDVQQERMLSGHFYVADAKERAKSFQEYYGKLHYALSGLFNRRLAWPAKEHAGALLMVAYKLPTNPTKYLGKPDIFPVQGGIHPLAVKRISLIHLTAGTIEKLRQKFLPEFKRLKEMHMQMPVEEIEKRQGPITVHWPSAAEVEDEFHRALWAALEKEVILEFKRIKRESKPRKT